LSKTAKISIIVIVALALATLLYFVIPKEGAKKKEDTPEYLKELKDQKRNSKGTFILYELLKEYKNTVSLKTISDPIDETLRTYNSDYPTVYFLIDSKLKFSQNATDSLYEFVKKGNTAFVSAESLNDKFYDYFFSRYPFQNYRDTIFKLNFYHQDLKLNTHYPLKIVKKGKIKKHSWRHIMPYNCYYKEDLVVISTDKKNNKPIFIKFPVGDGWLYIHAVPEAFYNESMFTEGGLEYAESVFSNLPKGHYLWHEHSKKWDKSQEFDKNNTNNKNIKRESPLQYILGNRSLRWAYILLLSALFLYIAFKVKRKQRIIPPIEPNNNNSLDFVSTVSNLYLQQDKHYKFIKHYEQSFIQFIKDKYYIASPTIDKQYFNDIAAKSQIEESKIEAIFVGLANAKKTYNFTDDNLISLHKKIEYFYKNCQ
jgi:hypothetical protein